MGYSQSLDVQIIGGLSDLVLLIGMAFQVHV